MPGGFAVVPPIDAPAPFPEPQLAPGEILVPQSGGDIFPAPPIDSTVVPPADAPLLEAPEEARFLKPAVFIRRSRPNFAPFLLGPPPRSASGR
jgi:hypothetical protein